MGRRILNHWTTREVPIQYSEGRACRISDALDVGCERKREAEDEMLGKHLHSRSTGQSREAFRFSVSLTLSDLTLTSTL